MKRNRCARPKYLFVQELAIYELDHHHKAQKKDYKARADVGIEPESPNVVHELILITSVLDQKESFVNFALSFTIWALVSGLFGLFTNKTIIQLHTW